MVSDGSFIPANVAENSLVELKQEIDQSTIRYLDALDDELRQQPGYREPVPTVKENTVLNAPAILIADI